jgi:predicted membrane protein
MTKNEDQKNITSDSNKAADKIYWSIYSCSVVGKLQEYINANNDIKELITVIETRMYKSSHLNSLLGGFIGLCAFVISVFSLYVSLLSKVSSEQVVNDGLNKAALIIFIFVLVIIAFAAISSKFTSNYKYALCKLSDEKWVKEVKAKRAEKNENEAGAANTSLPESASKNNVLYDPFNSIDVKNKNTKE